MALKRLGFSWKKAKKLLCRADPEERQRFVQRVQTWLYEARRGEYVLVYWDEAHVHQDTDAGYGWAPKGTPFWVSSCSPGLYAKVTFYGLYVVNERQVRIWAYERGNGEHTIEALKRLAKEYEGRRVVVVWDGAPYHRGEKVKAAARELGIELRRQPAYSPDLQAVEGLWRWLREEVTYLSCHTTRQELLKNVADFESRINQEPQAIAARLKVRSSLNSQEELLRFSK